MGNNKEAKKELSMLEKQLQNPKIYNNKEKLKEISKKYNELKKILDKVEQIKEIDCKISDAQKMLNQESAPEMIEMIKQEIEKLENKKRQAKKELQKETNNSAIGEKNAVIIEIRAGTGGDEACLFAADLFRMYYKFAEKMKWKTKIISSHPTNINGFKEIIFEIKGENVYQLLSNESGIHRVQRIPDTEKSGRIHTSAASVVVLPKAKKVDIKIENKELRIDHFRSSGHGGQNVQKNETAIRITHLPTNIVVSCQDERSQKQNKEKALTILRSRLLLQKKQQENKNLKQKRQSHIGTGDRSEKIRTYNFPQDRVTDHRIHKSWHGLEQILNGNIGPIIKNMQKK
ncbi:peptide chain release factor 1 [Candidatus Parcubacteria bacterium 4484_255]|nr:MAG: peptide chain release factor 1 [Candidatus Parcubacteria bacterium 4484_255]